MAMVIETGPGPAASARDEFALDLRPSGVRYRGSSCRSAAKAMPMTVSMMVLLSEQV